MITRCRYVETDILDKDTWKDLKSMGIEFATLTDAGDCLLKILSDKMINGHSLFLSARKWASRGYIDLDLDDYEDERLKEITEDQLKGSDPDDKLFLN
jgi:hypothetical protein